jgi:predicted Rossmann-fold nucleotide-binding protein
MASIRSGLTCSSVLVDGSWFTPATTAAGVDTTVGVAVAAAAVGATGAVVVGVAVGAMVGVADGATVNGGRVGGTGTDAPPAHANVRNRSLINETRPFRASALP